MPTKDEMMKFAEAVEKLVDAHHNHYEAIVEYCKQTGMEIELAATLVNSNLKAKIEAAAQDRNLLPKSTRLPF
jgi:DNA-binding ferritin-like protein (Dps family)